MSDSRFRPKHPGVPREWTLLGEGGNALVWGNGSQAIKRLKAGTSPEGVARFKREAEILLSLGDEPELRVVPIVEVREREGALEIVMVKMDGSLESALNHFAGNPERAAAALEPVASTLSRLADRTAPIIHRDLKPANLLFSESPDQLYLADFGCAFLPADERLTPLKRAIGAWAYRPPEHSVGRLSDVTEKGDVFSLGKVLWAMINGEPGVVFPGPVWFDPEYDLARKYPTSPRTHHAMLAISRAAAINPNARPSMKQMAEILSDLSSQANFSEDQLTMIDFQRAQSVIEIEFEQRRASAATFVRALHMDLHQALSDLTKIGPELLLWSDWNEQARRTPQTAEALVEQVAVHESDAPVVNSRFRRILLNTRFHPATDRTGLCFIARVGSENNNAATSSFAVTLHGHGILFEEYIAGGATKSGSYNSVLLREFLIEATRRVLR